MIPEFDLIGDCVIIICQECGEAGEGESLVVDDRFYAFRCDCGKMNMLPRRFVEKQKRTNLRNSKKK